MAKGSTKYQLLKDDFDHACRELKLRNEIIEDLRKENEKLKKEKTSAYHQGYKQGRFDKLMEETFGEDEE